MKRFIMYSDLKPEKVEDYVKLHAEPWPELLKLLDKCNIHNYSIALRGTQLFTYYEYTGDDYEADMEVMDASPVMHEWWKYSKPCFVGHEKEEYYEDLQEVFYFGKSKNRNNRLNVSIKLIENGCFFVDARLIFII